MKLCVRCLAHLPLSSFAKQAKQKDGLQAYCRPCVSAYGAAWRDRNNYPDLLVQLLARLSPIDGEPYTRLRQRLTANQEAKRHFVEFIAEAGGTLNPR